MNEQQFLKLAETALERLFTRFEAADIRGDCEIERTDESLLITLSSGQQYVINRHTPMRQMWLSSPISGGLHFSWNETRARWELKDGRELERMLEAELPELIT